MNILRGTVPYLVATTMAGAPGCFGPDNYPSVDATRNAAHTFVAETLRESPCKDLFDRLAKGLARFGLKIKLGPNGEKAPNRTIFTDENGKSEIIVTISDTFIFPGVREVLAIIGGFGTIPRTPGSFAGVIRTDCDDSPSAEAADTSQEDFSRKFADAAIEIIGRNLGCIATGIDAQDYVQNHFVDNGATYTKSEDTAGFKLIIRITFPDRNMATVKASGLYPEKKRDITVTIGSGPGQPADMPSPLSLWHGEMLSICTNEL